MPIKPAGDTRRTHRDYLAMALPFIVALPDLTLFFAFSKKA
jgi:hypothetical protein